MAKDEQTHFWRVPELGDAELLSARFYTHAYARHVHDRYALGVITAGRETFFLRGSHHVAGPGQVVMVNPDEPHDGMAAAAEEGWGYRMVYLEPAVLEGAMAELGGRGLPFFPRAVVEDPELAAALVGLHRDLEAGDRSPLESESRFLPLLARLLRRHAAPTPLRPPLGEAGRGRVRRVRALLDARYDETLRLEELAAEAGMSPLAFLRRFRREVGLPPYAYLQQRRLLAAAERLREGEAPAAVAQACGFADQAHLTRQFKRQYGVTPAAFRSGSFKPAALPFR